MRFFKIKAKCGTLNEDYFFARGESEEDAINFVKNLKRVKHPKVPDPILSVIEIDEETFEDGLKKSLEALSENKCYDVTYLVKNKFGEGTYKMHYYVRAKTEEELKQRIGNLPKIKNSELENPVESVMEISYDEYKAGRDRLAQKQNRKYFDIVAYVLDHKSNSSLIHHYYVQANDENHARSIAEEFPQLNRRILKGKIKEINEISYKEYAEGRKRNGFKYFKVTARCGHVGRGLFVPIDFFVMAPSKEDAAAKVKVMPRVKKTINSQSIIQVEEVNREEYEEGCEEMNNNPYLHHDRITEKDEAMELEMFLSEFVQKVPDKKSWKKELDDEEIAEMKKTKRYKRQKLFNGEKSKIDDSQI